LFDRTLPKTKRRNALGKKNLSARHQPPSPSPSDRPPAWTVPAGEGFSQPPLRKTAASGSLPSHFLCEPYCSFYRRYLSKAVMRVTRVTLHSRTFVLRRRSKNLRKIRNVRNAENVLRNRYIATLILRNSCQRHPLPISSRGFAHALAYFDLFVSAIIQCVCKIPLAYGPFPDFGGPIFVC
jgi:hypothetical protein